MSTKLYVGNLAYSVSLLDLQQLFAQAGQVRRVAIKTISGQSKGFGFIEMASPAEASVAKEQFHKIEFQGYPIQVSLSRPPGDEPWDPDEDYVLPITVEDD